MATRRVSWLQGRLLRDLALVGYYGATLVAFVAVILVMTLLVMLAMPGGGR